MDATASHRLASGLWSRACTTRTILPDPSAGVDEFIARLGDRLGERRCDVLLPGTDETLYAVSRRRERLAPLVSLGLPDHAVVERALDKICLAEEAAGVGLGTPEARVCERPADGLEAARSFGFPVLVKGTRTIRETGARLVRYPTYLAEDEPALRDAQPRFGPCIVQRRQPGALMSFIGVATERGLLGSVLSRYHRTWPAGAGQASFLETVTVPGALSEQVQALVQAIGWIGPFQLQLIEDPRGALRAIDFNPRLFGSLSVARAAGVPLASLWCAWLLGEDPQPVSGRPGVHYRMEDMDARHILWRLGQGDYGAAARAAWPRRHTTHAYFRARDPLPLLLRGVELAYARWRHRRPASGSPAQE